MTRTHAIRHVGWFAAILALGVLAADVQAKPNQRGQKNQRQQERRQVQKKQQNKQRAQAKQKRQHKKTATQNRDAQGSRLIVGPRPSAKSQKESSAHAHPVVNVASTERGANWGVNAQRKKLEERQREIRQKNKRLEEKAKQQRQDLREAKDKFAVRVDKQKQILRQRDDRLDAKAQAIRHAAHHNKPVKPFSSTHHYKNTHRTHINHGIYRKPTHSTHYRHHDHDRSKFGISFHIGSNHSSGFYYVNGHKRHHCCTGGYYTWKWVRPVVATCYDACGLPYTKVVRRGYHKRVWIPHHCTSRLHVYYCD